MPDDQPDHFIRHDDLEYGEAPLNGTAHVLKLDLCLPRKANGPTPLVLWIHGGGFRSGSKTWAGHKTDSRWLTKAGYAYASMDYRLKAREDDLSPTLRARLGDLQAHRDPAFREDLSGAAALAALEDAVTALAWLDAQRDTFGLSDWTALGGNSAGAITAFNLVHLSGFFGLSRPAIRGVVSISGGFAYPALYAPALAPVFALHSPKDNRVDVASIRQVAQIGGDAVNLVEADTQLHGRIRAHPDEPPRKAYGRILGFLDGLRGVG